MACGPTTIRRKRDRWRCNQNGASRGNRRNRVAYRRFLKDKCERCGFLPANLVQLDIHHKDKNYRNNDPRNLETVCANCHRLDNIKTQA